MNINYKITERVVQTTDGSRELRYFTSIDHPRHIDQREFIDKMHDQYGIPVYQTLAVLDALQRMVVEYIEQGNVVEVPSLGIFKISARAKSVADQRDAGDKCVSRIRVNFLPCKEIGRRFAEIGSNKQKESDK